MSHRFVLIAAALAIPVAVLSCGGADSLAPNTFATPSDSILFAGLYASGPIPTRDIAADRIGASGSAASLDVSWVSLIPGTVPDGTTATIVNRRTAQRITVAIVDGGFDPQPISASVGDTVEVSASRVGEPDATAVMALIARPTPRIVRTRPPRGQTDAPLNTVITIVFSEPLNPASVNSSSVTLTTAGSPVAGQVRLVPGPGYVVEFTPSTLLAPLTTYSLTVSGVASLSGTSLAATSIFFTTSTTTGPGSAIAPGGQAVREILVNSHFLARGLVASGTGAPLSTTWRSRDPSIATVEAFGFVGSGYVVGIRPGSTVIEGSALGTTAAIAVTVLAPAPSSVVSPVVIAFRMLEFHYDDAPNFWSYAPDIVLVDSTGRGGSAIVAASFDLPGLGSSVTCVMDRAVGSDPFQVFHEKYGDFELTLESGLQRASGSEAVAHITLRIPGPAALKLDVRGPIVPGSVPTTYSDGWYTDALSCGP